MRPASQRRLLQVHRDKILCVELRGELFFGSSQQVLQQVLLAVIISTSSLLSSWPRIMIVIIMIRMDHVCEQHARFCPFASVASGATLVVGVLLVLVLVLVLRARLAAFFLSVRKGG